MRSEPPAPSDASAATPSGSLLKGFALLEQLSGDDAPLGISDLARRLDMPKSGVHRLLQAMRSAGWVRQTESGEYECTLKLWELGQRVANRIDLRKAAERAMRELSAQTRETILLSVLDGAEVLYLDAIDSPQPVRVHTNPGDRAPSFCVATGKAMLAHAPTPLVDAAAQRLRAFTPQTLVTREQLDTDLERARRKGYAVNRGEWTGGVHGIAAPIFDGQGRVVAAISVGGPGERMSDSVIRRIAPLVVEAARSVSRELGHRSA